MEDESVNKKVTSFKVLLFLKGSCSPFLMKNVLTGICQVVKIVMYEGKGLNFNKNLLRWHDFKIILFFFFK